MEPRFQRDSSKSPPFCSGDGKIMSLAEQQIQQIQGENGTEYTLITAPLQNSEGEVVHQVIQHVGSDQQENIDPQTQVFMLQPFSIANDQFSQDQNGQQYEQVHIPLEQLQSGQVTVPLSEGQLVDGQYQQVLVSTGPDGQQHQIIIHQEVAPHLQQQLNQQLEQLEGVAETQPTAGTSRQSASVQPPLGKGPFACEICDKVFPKWNQLQRHLRSHEDDKPFRCTHCPNTYNVEGNLRLHMATHSVEPVCPECGKKFSRIASLKAHIMLHEREENLMCTECGDEFSLQSQLDRHMKEHRQEQEGTRIYQCRQCSMEFTKHNIYRDHMKQHNKVRSSLSHRTYKRNVDRTGFCHKCNNCGKTFQKPSQLQRHARIHTGERPFKCDCCEKAFNQKGALQIHMTRHTGQKPHTCDFCPMTFSQKGNLRAHIRRVHSTPKNANTPVFQCEECSCVFRKLGSLNAHMSRMHSDSATGLSEIAIQLEGLPGSKPQIIVADNLQGALEEVQQRAAQAEGKNGPVNPIIIQQLMELDGADAENVQQQITQISQAVGGGLNSDILQQALENSGLSIVPAAGGQQPQGQPHEQQQQQQGDGASSSTAGAGEGAGGSEGQPSTSGGTEGQPAAEGSAAAAVTGIKEFHATLRTLNILDASTGLIKKHLIRKVNGVRWHQCTYCAKEFKKPSDLVRHIRIHTHEKPYKCSQCFRAFAVKSTLTAHVKTHSGQKDHRCHQCDKLFSTVGSLRVHTRLHTGVKPFECPHCDKKFRTSGHCKSHIASHFKDSSPRKRRKLVKRSSKPDIALPDIPLQEPILITDTGYIQQAPRHSQFFNQYLGEAGSVDRPYKCGYCSRGFKKSSHLKQHVRSHTGEKPYKCNQCLRSFISSGVLKAHIRTHTGEKCYKCVICDATFTTNGSLKRHMSTHSEKRPFMCPYCQRTFKTSVNCKKHMKTHRHELALQALQTESGEKNGELPPEDQDVAEAGGDDDHDDGADDAPETDFAQTDIQQVELATLQQQALTQDQQLQSLAQPELTTATASLEQQDLTQQTIIQDALVSDAQFQSTLNQQVLGGQQVTLQPQQNFTQNLLNISAPQQTFNQLNFSQPQFTLQNGQSIDVGSLASLTQPNSAITATLTSTNMQNILQTREPELAEAQSETEMGQDEMGEDGKKSYACPLCGKGFKKSSHLKQHVRTHTGEKPFGCDQCGRQFVSPGVLKAHQRTHTGSKDYQCHVCEASFTTNGSLTRHMMIHSTLRPFKCPLCPESFRTAFLCKKHMKAHRDGSEGVQDDSENDRPKRTRSTIIQISEEQAKELSKQQPDATLTVSEKLLIESAAEKDRVSEIQEKRPVPVDPEPEDPADENGNDQTYKPGGSSTHTCRFCNKTFRKPSDLIRHTRIHTGEKPFDCPICGRCFTVKSTLDSHLRTHKSTEKKFRCHVCSSSFSTKGSLKVHMRLHTGAKPFKCSHCDMRFRTSGHRKSHIASHFKPAVPKKPRKYGRRGSHQAPEVHIQDSPQVDILNLDPQILQNLVASGANQLQVGNQVINIEQPLLSAASGSTAAAGQGIMPLSLSLESLGLTESGLAAQALQGMDSVQLQLGNLGQNIQITGLDPNVLTQTIQIDASMLAQLQQGAISLSFNPNVIQTADPNLVQSVQIQQPSTSAATQEVLNPNVVVQPFTQQSASTTATATPTTLTTQGGIVHQVSTPNILDLNQLVNNEQILRVEVANPGTVQQQQVQRVVTSQSVTGMTDNEDDDVGEGGGMSDDDDMNDPAQEGVSEENLEQLESAGIHLTAADGTTTQHFPIMIEPINGGTPERIHICPLCQKGFRRASHLKEHVQTHNPNHVVVRPKSTPHICRTCDKAFAKPSQLERHIRIHTGERPFVCEICKRAFNQKNALQIHMKKHNGERPFKCAYCEQTFTQKGNLKTHIKRTHHMDMVQTMNIGRPEGQAEIADLEGVVQLLA